MATSGDFSKFGVAGMEGNCFAAGVRATGAGLFAGSFVGAVKAAWAQAPKPGVSETAALSGTVRTMREGHYSCVHMNWTG